MKMIFLSKSIYSNQKLMALLKSRSFQLFLTWMPFFLLFWWRWRLFDFFGRIPEYGDSLEVLWGISWYQDLLSSSSPLNLVYDRLFHPEGFQVITFAFGPGTFAPLVPLSLIAGRVFAYNVGNFGMLFLGYAGTFKLTRKLNGSKPAAILAALLYSFWFMRWSRLNGPFNVLLGSTTLPWMIWALEHGFRLTRNSTRRFHLNRWFVFTGLLWALATSSSWYFSVIGFLVIGGWIFGRWLTKTVSNHQLVRSSLSVSIPFLIVTLPLAFLFIQGLNRANVPPADIVTLNGWGASLNGITIPAPHHPWLSGLVPLIYQGPTNGSDGGFIGLVTSIIAFLSLPTIWKNRKWRPLILILVTGFILGLGITLKWDGESIQSPLLRPITEAIWALSHQLKPSLFPSEIPLKLRDSLPLPVMILDAAIPYFEGARISARFLIITGLSSFVMVSLFLERVRPRFISFLIAGIMIFELVPFQFRGVPAPFDGHPAFVWLRNNLPEKTGIVDIYASGPAIMQIKIDGATLYATELHGAATASGASSVWPEHTQLLMNIIQEERNGFESSELLAILRTYDVRYILFHVFGPYASAFLPGIEQNSAIKKEGCFPPASTTNSPWPYPICVLEILPAETTYTNLLLEDGWSGSEAWGIWSEDEQATARWFVMKEVDHYLKLSVFPNCLPDQQQEMAILVNGTLVSETKWTECQTITDLVRIPKEFVVLGWNQIGFEFDYALRPFSEDNTQSFDTRALAVGFTELAIDRDQ